MLKSLKKSNEDVFSVLPSSCMRFARRRMKDETLALVDKLLFWGIKLEKEEKWCPGSDSNRYVFYNASTWSWCVYQFRHLGPSKVMNTFEKQGGHYISKRENFDEFEKNASS